MKRKMFSIMAIAAIAVASCKKEEPVTIELGEAVITGNVWADLDQTNDMQNGVYVQDLNPEGVQGMQVSVQIDSKDLDQTPDADYDYEVNTYTATTDAAGNYTLTLPAIDVAFGIDISYQTIYTSRTILAEDGVTGVSEAVEVMLSDKSASIYAGATIAMKDEAVVAIINNSATAENYGSATMFGNVYANWNVGPDGNNQTGCWNGVYEEIGDASSPLAGKSLYWAYQANSGPHNTGDGIWKAIPIAADGSYTFDIVTEGADGNSVDIMFGFDDFIGSYTRQSVVFAIDSVVTAIYSTDGKSGRTQNNFTAGELRNLDLCGYIDATEL